ncbi:MAG: F0F1 ATP synthase subunit delta [Gammaproteobacteria bacterium]|nr:F0F1 ATP synthase subunit delta [Gammaproteobacteria bacterium]
MAEAATLARPYAKAAFEAARESEALGPWASALARAAGLVADERVQEALTSPKLSAEDFVRFFAGLGDAGIDARWQNFVRVLAANKRLVVLAEIATQFEALKAEYEREIGVEVTSAAAMSAEQSAKLCAALAERLKRRVRVENRIDPSLIGGAVIRAGDLVIDGSLTGRLKKLASELGS